ncbi:MAG: LLM class flavin-dependent oxidoreductase [Rhodospirillaceae bacterium]|mgnify:FL=1|nr:LLM class flavin-dependent oxidoreductase [Rhodospirillaceae bacterium]
MKFAHFAHVWNKPDMSPNERYEQLWRELILCDELGFDYGFCVEHHFTPHESWMSAPSLYTVGAGARTKNMRVGPMGYIVPLYHPLRLAEEISVIDQMLNGRMELGLVPGINAKYFEPFGLDYDFRKSPTMEYLDYLTAAFGEQPFSFDGEHHQTKDAHLSVLPVQKPHPPLWMMSRDPETLELLAAKGVNTGNFLVFPRDVAAPRYLKYLEDWKKAGWDHKPNIAYATTVYVDESDDKALEVALHRASRAYEGILPAHGDTFENRLELLLERFWERGEDPAVATITKIFDPAYILENDLVFIGSPETVAEKLHKASRTGVFNTFMGEFNFADLPEEDLMRSIRLFGEKVIPELHDFEPY